MAVFNNILAGASGATGAAAAFQIDRSLRFNSGDSAYLNHTPTSASNRKTWTWSGWIKRTVMGADKFIFSAGSDPSNFHYVRFNSNDKIEATEKIGDSVQSSLITSAVYRDPSAWMHIVYVYDSTQSTAANRLSLYVNGEKITSFGTSTYPSQNHDSYLNSTSNHFINARPNPAGYADAYLAEIHFIDGQALTADDFGEEDDNGVWQPIDCKNDLTYGTNGFYLNFSDNSSNSALGFDQRPGATQNPSVTGYGSATGGSPDNVVDGVASYTSEYDIRTNGAGVTLGTAVTASSKVRIYGTAESGSYEINDTSTNIAPSSWPNRGWTDISSALTFPISISSFGITGGSANDGGRLAAIEIDDVILTGTANNWTVNNLTAAGSAWNQSQTWSSSLSSTTGFRSSEPATNAFDGDTSTICSAVNDGVVTFTSPVTFASDSTIRVIVHGGDHTVTVNGGSDQTISAGSYQTVSFTNSSNSTFTMTFQRDASADTGIRAIEIGGNVLVDSSVVDPDAEEIDSLIDTPTNYTASSGNNGGNYATLNPLDFASSGSPTLKNGNLDAEAGSGWQTVAATIGNLTSGKWYWEVKLGGGSGHRTGLSSVSRSNASASDLLGSGDIALNSADGRVYVDGTEVGTGAGNLSGKTVGIALNLDANSVSFYQNNSLVHTVSSLSSTASWTPVHATRYSVVDHLNFGQRSFAYTPPTGFLSLCTTNLPDPTIADGSTVFDAVAYSGNGGTQSITGVNFSPDFLWFKRRQSPTRLHMLYDTVRGASGDKVLKSDSTGDESWDTSTYGQLDSADSNGFTVTDGSNTDDNINSNNDSYIAWLWDAGTSTVSNTDGDITSSVRANQTAGFSIVTYTGNGTDGATVGHGLNDNVALYFMKNRSSTANWAVLGHALNDAFGGSQKYLQLNTQIAAGTAAQGPGDSSTIELHTDSTNNTNGDNYVAYCFAAVEGYSAFGHYVSNNDANGPFVYLGFQAKLIMWKNLDGAHGWYIYDDTRDPDNPMSKYLAAHSNIAEGDPGGEMDVLSNGFKVRNTGADMNRDSHKILYMAWAEHPFKTARAR